MRDSLAQAELTGEIDAMTRELTQDRALLQEALEAHVRLIAVWLQRQMRAGVADAPKETAAQRLVRRYAQDIVRGYASPRSMGEYAEGLDVTPTHLTRVCRKVCGRTARRPFDRAQALRRAAGAGSPETGRAGDREIPRILVAGLFHQIRAEPHGFHAKRSARAESSGKTRGSALNTSTKRRIFGCASPDVAFV